MTESSRSRSISAEQESREKSTSLTTTPTPNQSVAGTIWKGLPTLFALAVMGGGWMLIHYVSSEGSSEVTEDAIDNVASLDRLILPKGKLDAAQFDSVEAKTQLIQHKHTVPGRLRYDATAHVDVKAPMDGILAELVVTPGDHVAAGDLIAVLRSPEIGQARAEILKRQKDLDIAQQLFEREQTVATNLLQISKMLDENVAVEAIESSFSDRTLGAFRQEILSAYAKMRLADELVEKVQPLVASGAVSGRVVREREAERQLAATSLRAARDQAAFAIEQATLKAEAAVAEADRQLNLAWQFLEMLLGYKEEKSLANLKTDEALSRLEIRAPFTGTIESQGFATKERVMRGESLVVLANTSSLSVEASIRESDWSAVALQPGAELSVMVPALDEEVFKATVRYFGREVRADTNSIPLVARVENVDGRLRPGMFVRVTIPVGVARQALSIKPESIIQHENRQFVFIDQQDGAYKRVDVTTGHSSDDWVEVTDGLQPGDLVVTDGAFLLKSELLLQGEGE